MPTWDDYWRNGDRIGPGDDFYTCYRACAMAVQERCAAVQYGDGYNLKTEYFEDLNITPESRGVAVYSNNTFWTGGQYDTPAIVRLIKVIRTLVERYYVDDTLGPAYDSGADDVNGGVNPSFSWQSSGNLKYRYTHSTLEDWCENHGIVYIDWQDDLFCPEVLEWLRDVIITLKIAEERFFLRSVRTYGNTTADIYNPWTLSYNYSKALEVKFTDWFVDGFSGYGGLTYSSNFIAYASDLYYMQIGWSFGGFKGRLILDPDRFPGVNPSGKIRIPLRVPDLSKMFANNPAQGNAPRGWFSNGLQFPMGTWIDWTPNFTLTRGNWKTSFDEGDRVMWASEIIFNDYPTPVDWVGITSDTNFSDDAGPRCDVQLLPPIIDFAELKMFNFT